MKIHRNLSFAGFVQIFVTLMLIALAAFTTYAIFVCLKRGDIENVILLFGGVIMMIPIIVALIKTKF